MIKEVYCVSEFCERYALSRTGFYREIWAERLQVFKRGHLTLITRAEAERWFANSCKPPPRKAVR